MKSLLATIILLSMPIMATQEICNQMVSEQDNENFLTVIEEVDILTKETWYQTDVVLNFSYSECKEAITQELIEFNGTKYYRFRSIDDSCDGGNTYGSIYSLDLKTPIAHIYDQDMYCKSDWSAEETYAANKCNTQAKVLAEKKMKEFGLNFEATHARIKLRDPYIYDFINVEGKLIGSNKPIQLEVLVRLESCEFSTVRITNLNL